MMRIDISLCHPWRLQAQITAELRVRGLRVSGRKAKQAERLLDAVRTGGSSRSGMHPAGEADITRPKCT